MKLPLDNFLLKTVIRTYLNKIIKVVSSKYGEQLKKPLTAYIVGESVYILTDKGFKFFINIDNKYFNKFISDLRYEKRLIYITVDQECKIIKIRIILDNNEPEEKIIKY